MKKKNEKKKRKRKEWVLIGKKELLKQHTII